MFRRERRLRPCTTRIAGFLLAAALLLSATPVHADTTEAVAKLQVLPAMHLSPLMPKKPLSAWLARRLKATGVAVWEIGDCQDTKGKMAGVGGAAALCVTVVHRLVSGMEAALVVQVGTAAKPWSGRPRIHILHVRAGEKRRAFRTVRPWLEQVDLINRVAKPGK